MAKAKSNKLEDLLMDIADFVDSNVYLRSIKDAFTDYVPFIIVGSFGSLLSSLISSTSTGLAQWIPALANLAPAFTAMNFAAVSCMTVPIIFLIAMNLAKAKDMSPFITGVLAIICYFAMVPNTVEVVIEEATGSASGLAGGVLGAQGLFIGMLVAVVITNIFHWLTSIDKIKIKMPPSVPQGIANSFNILVPVFIIIVLSAVFGTLFHLITGSYVNEFIYNVVQAPLSAAVQSSMGVVIMAVVCQLFWFLGIHGGLVVEPIRSPISAAGLAENIAAVQAGLEATQPLTRGFWTVFVVVGGAGLTLSLIFAILLSSGRITGPSLSCPCCPASAASASRWSLACPWCSTPSLPSPLSWIRASRRPSPCLPSASGSSPAASWTRLSVCRCSSTPPFPLAGTAPSSS